LRFGPPALILRFEGEREIVQKHPQPRHVYVVDDNRDVRRSLSYMLGASDLRSRPFGSGQDFLEAIDDLKPGCVLLDLRMPQMDGFAVMEALAGRGVDWPVIVMTGHGEISIAVRAMKQGAIDFIQKPFAEEALSTCLDTGFRLLAERLEAGERHRAARERVDQLTGRETEVLEGLLAGESNKQLASRLGISLRTVEMHRGNMMDRLGVGNLAEALTLAMEAGLKPANGVANSQTDARQPA
jgi:FixJ family two-component response regulator